MPFTAQYQYVFRTDNVRGAQARLSPADRAKVTFNPESIDWRRWFFEVHAPGLEKWVFPEIEAKLKRPRRVPERHETLPLLLEEAADRFGLTVALGRTEGEGVSGLSYRELRTRARATAERLRRAGVKPGDRVLLIGKNAPAWPITFFGILLAGATTVPVDFNVEVEVARNTGRGLARRRHLRRPRHPRSRRLGAPGRCRGARVARGE